MKDTTAKKTAGTDKGGKSKNEEKGSKRMRDLAVKNVIGTKKQRRTQKKAKKDPNQPKRPPTAFFVFLEDFRKIYKENHPNAKGVAVVGKAGGDKWKEMTDAEKAPFLRKAASRKADYDKAMTNYKQKQQVAVGDDEGSNDESEKSKSEIHDEDSEEEEDDDE